MLAGNIARLVADTANARDGSQIHNCPASFRGHDPDLALHAQKNSTHVDCVYGIERREVGLGAEEAIREACLLRFRPIMMTSLAAIFGALPIALGTGAGAELRQPLGVAVVGGLLVSQLLTLYITPVVYLYLDKADRLLKRRLNPVVEEHDAHELPAPHVIAAEWGSPSRRTRSG